MLTQLEDNSDAVQSLGQNFWNVFWLRLFNLPAWLAKCVQELKIVLSLFPANLNFLLKSLKLLKVRAVSCVQYLDDLFEILVLKSLDQHVEVGSSLIPVSNLIERTIITVTGWGILVGDQVLDLSGPLDHC